MYDKKVLGLKESLGAIEAMIQEVEKGNYWKRGGFAVVDTWGVLIAFARMDGSNQVPFQQALRKAYSAVMWGKDTSDLLEFIKERPWDESTYGTEWTVCPGGVLITEPGYKLDVQDVITTTPELSKLGLAEKTWQFTSPYAIGAIGVSGVGPYPLDDAVARVGVEYIQSVLWPGK